jgi:uncharacterized membrane protein
MSIRPSILQTEHVVTEHIEGTGHANKKRSLVKTLTWRIIASTDTFIVGMFVTNYFLDTGADPAIAATIAGFEVVTKMLLYYLHERGWSKSDWGLEDVDVDAKALELRPVH